ncbi:hypothetical protein OHB49_00215 [Streptomyces sp. NBC_01717]
MIDAQNIKTSTSVPAARQCIDAGKKLAMLVTAASVPDSIAGTRLVEQVAASHPTICKAWGYGGYRQHLVEHAAALGRH